MSNTRLTTPPEKKPIEIKDVGTTGVMSFVWDFSTADIQKALKDLYITWLPLINDLEEIKTTLTSKKSEFIAPEISDQPGLPSPTQEFLEIVTRILEKAQLMQSTSYGLYLLDNNDTTQVGEKNAIILYKEGEKYFVHVRARESLGAPANLDLRYTDSPNIRALLELQNKKRPDNSIIITKENFELINKIKTDVIAAAKLKPPPKNRTALLSIGISIFDDLEPLLTAASKLPYANMLSTQLNKLKDPASSEFNVSFILKKIESEQLAKLRKKIDIDKVFNRETFNALSPDEQAVALALMESYNTAIKLAVLKMDEIEIEHGLIPGSLSTKIKIIDNKSIEELCTEFSEKYQTAMRRAKFTTFTELYPYHYSIIEQRKAMLKKLDEKKEEKSPIKERILERNKALGEVIEIPKRREAQDFYTLLKGMATENYAQLKQLKNQIDSQKALTDEKKLAENVEEQKSLIMKIEEELKKVLDEKLFEQYFLNETKPSPDSPWIQQVGNAFQHVKKIIATIERLQAVDPTAEQTPFGHLESKAAKMNALAAEGIKLATALSNLQGDMHFRNLISSNKSIAMLKTEEIETAKNNAMALYDLIKKSGAPLQTAIKKLTLNNSPMPFNDAQKILDFMRDIKKIHRSLNDDTDKSFSLLELVSTHFTKIINLINSLPEILSLITKYSKEQMAEMAIAINDTLINLLLLSDKLEIEFCLKEGYLTNQLKPYVLSYYETVNRLGYDFNDKYPFVDAIAKQRRELFDKAPNFQKELIHARSIDLYKQEEEIAPNRQAFFEMIDIELAHLRKQRGITYFAHTKPQIKILEERIDACENLRHLLKNHSLTDSLKKLSNKESELLKKYSPLFVVRLKKINNDLPEKQKPKTILEKTKKAVVDMEETVNPIDNNPAIILIDKRIKELQSAFIINIPKHNLLTLLYNELRLGVPLNTAIHKIKKENENAYLLFEGRTGKTIKSAQNKMITKAELMDRLQYEINLLNLKQQDPVHLWFFGQSRKNNLAKQIETLTQLKTTISESEKDVKTIINELDKVKKTILQQYEPDLLKDLMETSPKISQTPSR